MLGTFEATELKTIYTTEEGAQLEVQCNKVPDDAWHLSGYGISKLSLYEKARLISEIVSKDEIDAISYSDYDTTFTLSGKHTTEQVLVEMAKKM